MAEKIDVGSTLGFGCMGLTAFYGPALQNEEGIAVMEAAYNAGIRHFDTAQVYQQYVDPVPGTYIFNEELVGAFVKKVGRENVTIATKFFPRQDPPRTGEYKYSKEMLFEETENSLKRLGVDYIDVYYLHRMYPEETVSIETFMSHMKELVEAKKIRAIGLSECSPAWIRRAHKVFPVGFIQQEWSLFARDLEEEVVPTCKELGIQIVAYSPIARGLLGGALTEAPKDWRATVPYLSEENLKNNRGLVAQMEEMAKGKGATLAQLCIAWVMSKGAIPIPGTTKASRAGDNAKAMAVKLTPEEVEKLEGIAANVVGPRGSDDYMSKTFHSN